MSLNHVVNELLPVWAHLLPTSSLAETCVPSVPSLPGAPQTTNTLEAPEVEFPKVPWPSATGAEHVEEATDEIAHLRTACSFGGHLDVPRFPQATKPMLAIVLLLLLQLQLKLTLRLKLTPLQSCFLLILLLRLLPLLLLPGGRLRLQIMQQAIVHLLSLVIFPMLSQRLPLGFDCSNGRLAAKLVELFGLRLRVRVHLLIRRGDVEVPHAKSGCRRSGHAILLCELH
mmetsp:Transcript_84612/g.244543  ORF Transcript_84612/g.244543 Transcript_84612/m.244543 type:complete len:228 (-) Transcript_84612:1441-2124(-)